MEALDRPSVESWSQARGYALNSRALPALRDSKDIERFEIPRDAGRRVAIVKDDMRAFAGEEEICVWIYDWNVWPSLQWHHLFDRFRASYGITEALEKRPALVVLNKEFEVAVSAVIYAVLMLWDCHVLGSSGHPFAFYSHDEFGKKRA